MGYAIAEEALRRGASVTLVTGPVAIAAPRGARLINIETAEQMLAACLEHADRCAVFVGAAAVADYTPVTVAAQKIKKRDAAAGGGACTIQLRLKPTDDILAIVGSRKRTDQVVVGFAAETEDLIGNARRKLKEKHADLIVANDVTMEGAGFDVDTNIVTVVGRDGEQTLPLLHKREVAAQLLDAIQRIRAARLIVAESGARK